MSFCARARAHPTTSPPAHIILPHPHPTPPPLPTPGYGEQFLRGLAEARAAVPAPVAARSGGVITSCPIHTTLIGGLSRRIVVAGDTLYQHITRWMDGASGWVIDEPFPANPTCPKPQEAAAAFDEYAPLGRKE